MSGEYYCIEEVVDPSYCCGDFDTKSNRSSNAARRNCHESEARSPRSTTSRKSQDMRLYEIEGQLEVAETRCNTLKEQLNSMKRIYNKTAKTEHSPVSQKTHTFLNRHSSRKRPSSPTVHQRIRACSPTKKRPVTNQYQESSDSIPQKSSSSSTALVKTTIALMNPKEQFSAHLVRQNPTTIGTDYSGAPARTIHNILSGITNSVNRLSKLHDNKIIKKRGDGGTTVFTIPLKNFTPQSERKSFQQQQKIAEIASHGEMVDGKTSTEDWNSLRYSITSMKSKSPSKTRWSRHTSRKTAAKSKIKSSSGTASYIKSVKSTAKHAENTTNLRKVRNSMVDEESQSTKLSRKRKRSVKRLKQASKLSVVKTTSDHVTQTNFNDNLVELYHNVAAKSSYSDDSNNPSKSQIINKKAGGDLVVNTCQVVPNFEVNHEEIVPKKHVNKIFLSQRMLTPINENTLMDNNCNKIEHFSNVLKNYQLPTIASKMRQVTKTYFQSFNFRSIPFCAAKSITPSHNIGLNIQQVMSIIKTRQPITGISATLAHNISLAAEKLQSRPLSVLVSRLSSKMGYSGASQCPLIRGSLNREQLQEMAKEIPEEPEDEQRETIETASFVNPETFSRGACGDREESVETVWSLDPTSQRRCTCASQKGVPFEHVLSKYQMSSNSVCVPCKTETPKSHITHRYTKATIINKSMRKQATKNWIKNEATQAVVNKKSEKNCFKKSEKNLKTVLQNLHDEFDSLNTKYEQLAKGMDQNRPEVNQKQLKDLNDMEKLLNKKEEEINMVMALYTEVVALKDQVKKLKERTSQPSIALTQNPSKIAEYKDHNAALHLTQLLRQIKEYQTRYKNDNFSQMK